MKRFHLISALGACVFTLFTTPLIHAAPVSCTGFCVISDGTASIGIDTRPEVDRFNFNGGDHLTSQVFHLRFARGTDPLTLDPGTANPDELSNHISQTAATEDEDANVIHLEHVEADGLDVRIDYTLTGGTNIATLDEVFAITNTSMTDFFAIDLFARTDWDIDLGGQQPPEEGDTAEFTGTLANPEFRQSDGAILTTVTADQIAHFDVSDFISRGSFVGADGNLQGRTMFGPGDAIHHLQFARFTLNPGESATFNINKTIQVVPVPAAVWLFCSGLLGLAGLARRKV